MATSLDKRVIGAVAVAAGGLAAADAHAALVFGTTNLGTYTETGNTSNDGTTVGVDIDVNQDGVADINVGSLTKNSTNTNRYNINGHAADPTNKNPVLTDARFAITPYLADTSTDTTAAAQKFRPSLFHAGDTVGPLNTFGLDAGGASNSLADNRNGGALFATDGSEQFIGVQTITAAGVLNYGFIGVELNNPVTSPSSAIKTFTITQYAFENQAGVAATIPGGATPEPASLAVLALGSVGLLGRRR